MQLSILAQGTMYSNGVWSRQKIPQGADHIIITFSFAFTVSSPAVPDSTRPDHNPPQPPPLISSYSMNKKTQAQSALAQLTFLKRRNRWDCNNIAG